MASDTELRIGDAAAELDIAAHVLRHWEDEGLLAPARSLSGHRNYDRDTLDRARMIQILQRAGMSLDQIRRLAGARPKARTALIEDKRAEIGRQIALLQDTDRFLDHVTDCRQRVIAECPECAEFVQRGSGEIPMMRFRADIGRSVVGWSEFISDD